MSAAALHSTHVSNNIAAAEFQLPENPPARIRSATVQFGGAAIQCSGNEPVVFEVFAYAGNGKTDVPDTTAGTRLAQLTADCKDKPAFARPIDVTQIVRQLSVPAGLRFVGFNIRKTNNRALPSYFGFSSAKLTIVVADQDLAIGTVGSQAAGGTAAGAPQGDAGNLLGRLGGAAATVIAAGGSKPSQQQGRDQAASAIKDAANTAPASAPVDAGARPEHPVQRLQDRGLRRDGLCALPARHRPVGS